MREGGGRPPLTEVGTRPWRGGTGGRRRTGLRGHRAPARPARALSGVSRISRKARLSRAGLQRPPAPESRSRSGPRTRPATPRRRRVLSAGDGEAVVAPARTIMEEPRRRRLQSEGACLRRGPAAGEPHDGVRTLVGTSQQRTPEGFEPREPGLEARRVHPAGVHGVADHAGSTEAPCQASASMTSARLHRA